MKITSIKLTSELEIKKEKGILDFGARRTPIYQVEYEETTSTGLKATGTMLLEANNEEKVDSFFKELEKSLIEPYLPKEGGTVTFGKEGLKFTGNVSIKPSFESLLREMIVDIIKLQKEEDVENFMKQISEKLKNSKGFR